MITSHRFNLLLRALIQDLPELGITSADLLELELCPLYGQGYPDEELLRILRNSAEIAIRRGAGFLLPAVSMGREAAWQYALSAEELAESGGTPYQGPRARFVHVCFDMPMDTETVKT